MLSVVYYALRVRRVPRGSTYCAYRLSKNVLDGLGFKETKMREREREGLGENPDRPTHF